MHELLEPKRTQTLPSITKDLIDTQDFSLKKGDSIQIGERNYRISKVAPANEVGKELGLQVRRQVPVYYLDGPSGISRGAYHPERDMILVFRQTDTETLRHELIHAIEYHQEKTQSLVRLYERALLKITEDSFEDGFITFNFKKNIHEFIADGLTKPALIDALKKEGLYDEFMNETAYLLH